MPTGGRHLHDPAAVEMPAHIPEVQRGPLPGIHVLLDGGFPATCRRFPVQHGDEVLQVADGPHRDSRHQRSLGLLAGRNDDLVEPAPHGGQHRR